MGSTASEKDVVRCKFEPNIFVTIALFMMMMGWLMLAIFACEYIPPYVYSKDFTETRCTVDSSYISANVCCVSTVPNMGECPESFVYPCAKVMVRYTVDGQDYNATLYDGSHSAAFRNAIDTCSYYHCFAQDYTSHLSDAENFISEHGAPSQQQACYYNPDQKNMAVLTIISFSTMLHSILWPFILILLSAAILLTVYVYIKKVPLTLDVEEVYANDDEEATKRLTAASDTSSEHSVEQVTNNSNHTKENNYGRNASTESQYTARPTTSAGIKVDLESMRAKSAKRNSKNSNGSPNTDMNITPIQ